MTCQKFKTTKSFVFYFMRDLWLQFLMIVPYASDIRFLVNSVDITRPPIKGIDTIFGNVTCITTGCVWVRPILPFERRPQVLGANRYHYKATCNQWLWKSSENRRYRQRAMVKMQSSATIYGVGMIRHQFSIWFQLQCSLCDGHFVTLFNIYIIQIHFLMAFNEKGLGGWPNDMLHM